MAEHLHALRASVERLRQLVDTMDEVALRQPAYPTEWTIADVLSHLGAGAVITQRRLEDALAGHDTPDDFAPQVWDEWNSKDPVAHRNDALIADAALIERLEATSAEQRDRFATAMGPMTFGFEQFVAMRLNEHALHSWDIEVVDHPAATLPPDAAALIVDNLDLIARFTATPPGEPVRIHVATTGPVRTFTVQADDDSVTLGPPAAGTSPDLILPAEAFSRLVYGRLDPRHTPPGHHCSALDVLRRIYPGP
jgi:uncharacterized protein (TIGR03083 family)